MKFEGSFVVANTRDGVWDVLTDYAVLERATPSVYRYRVIERDKLFVADVGVPMAGQMMVSSAEIEWLQFDPPEHLGIYAAAQWGNQCVSVDGDVWLVDVGETEVRFSAEVTAPHVPKSLLHSVVANFLKTFFTNLKAELAAQLEPIGNP